MVKAVTGRSFSTTVMAETGVTSMIQGEASSWRRKRVYAWISIVRPLIWNVSAGAFRLSAVLSALAPAGFCATVAPPETPRSISQV
jgi:hypothetical protein